MNKTETILSFEDACKDQGITTDLPDLTLIPEFYRKSIIAFYKLCVICKSLNGDWQADFTDHSQYKYFPWFYLSGGSSGYGADAGPFYAVTGTVSNTGTYFGARLASKDRNTAIFFGTHFLEIWKDYIIG